MKNNGQIRKRLLEKPISFFIDELQNGMIAANRSGDVCATIFYANRINILNEIVASFTAMDVETDGLFTEE